MESAFFISAVLLAVIPYTYQIPVVLPYNSAVAQNAEPTLESTRFRTEEAPSVATTTVHLPKDGTITASSTIEAIPADENQDPKSPPQSSQKRHKRSDELSDPLVNVPLCSNTPKSSRLRNLVEKVRRKLQTSPFIQKCKNFLRNNFRRNSYTAVTHAEDENTETLPRVIADYAPMTAPMVPSLVVDCINEIELRGMDEEGLYRVGGSIPQIERLKEAFLKGNEAPCLSGIDISTISSTLKDFLRSLREPLITVTFLADFDKAKDKQDAGAALYQAILDLPQPNRDTLAFLILHLQRVSSSPECKMPISNLATVFGPTLVGYSSQELTLSRMFIESQNQAAVVESLLKIPSDYWANFVEYGHRDPEDEGIETSMDSGIFW